MENMLRQVEEYIDGDLNESEIFAFEKLLSTNHKVKRDYLLSASINEAIVEYDVMELRDTMQDIFVEEPEVKRLQPAFNRRKMLYAAASVAMVMAVGGAVKYLGHAPDNEDIFQKFYTPYETTISYRSGNTETDRLLLRAMEYYEIHDYNKALLLFEEVLQTRKNDMSLNLYSGISYMEEEQYSNASRSFNEIIDHNDNLFVEQAKWYLSMCYIKTNEGAKAEILLRELIEQKSYYKDMASKVLKDLN